MIVVWRGLSKFTEVELGAEIGTTSLCSFEGN
jgi:hypothetical protein